MNSSGTKVNKFVQEKTAYVLYMALQDNPTPECMVYGTEYYMYNSCVWVIYWYMYICNF